MKISLETRDIRKKLLSGKVIDILGNLEFMDSVNCEKNKKIKKDLELLLYNEGYLPYFNEIPSDSFVSDEITDNSRAFYVDVDNECKLYISTKSDSSNFELKYITYDNAVSLKSMHSILHMLNELGMLITY